MIALLLFSVMAAGIVWIAGRKDAALDPKLTTVALGLLAVFPILMAAMPKLAILPVAAAADASTFPWKPVLIIVWAIGCLVALVKLGLAWRGLVAWRKRSALVELIDGVEIRKLEGLRGPVAAGVIRKMVFVPWNWQEWNADHRKIVLGHERAHHRRRDPLRRWIASIAAAVNWFNPLVRWIVRRLLIQCEFACDAEVLRGGVGVQEYAGLLCDLAEKTPVRGPMLAMAEQPGLEARVRRMAREGEHDRTLGATWLILLAVASAGLLAILGAEKIAGYTRSEIELRRTADPFPG